jgi:S1-C subfamily serine protease
MMGKTNTLVLKVGATPIEKKEGASRQASMEDAPDSVGAVPPPAADSVPPTVTVHEAGADGYDTSDDESKSVRTSDSDITFDYPEGSKLGLSLDEVDGGGVVVRKVVLGSIADTAGFAVGMQVIAVNGAPTHKATKAEVLALFKDKGTYVSPVLFAAFSSGEC